MAHVLQFALSVMNNGGRSDSVTSLLVGLFDDMRRLLVQEVQLAKDELLENWMGMKRGVLLFGGAVAVLALGAFSLMFMLVHVLQIATDLPLWACHAVVGIVLVLLGWALMKTGAHRLQQAKVIPRKTIETMKETTAWLEKQTESLKM